MKNILEIITLNKIKISYIFLKFVGKNVFFFQGVVLSKKIEWQRSIKINTDRNGKSLSEVRKMKF